MSNLKALFDKMMDDLNKKMDEKEVLVEGQSYLFDTPEFSDVKEMKKIFKAFEEKGKIVELLDKSIMTEGVKIYMGSREISNELEGVAVVTASCGSADRRIGTLGVIGPMRMDYSRIIPLVSSTARLLSCVLYTGHER
jgi:heat-inducible transcriptional repressor